MKSNKNKVLLLFRWALICMMVPMLFISCNRRKDVATKISFEDVGIGVSKTELLATMGTPISKELRGGDQEEYKYIERIRINDIVIEEREYTFLVANDRVVSKHVRNVTPRTTNILPRNSVDLQTSQN